MKALLSFCLFFGMNLMAHEEGVLGEIKGEHLGLYYTDHAVSGHVDGTLLFATPLVGEFGTKVVYRQNGADAEAIFKQDANRVLSGKIGNAEIMISKVKAQEGSIEGTLNGAPFTVKVSSEKMDENHFVEPKFEVTHSKGTYVFQLVNGKACMGCSVKLTFVVLGMLNLTGNL